MLKRLIKENQRPHYVGEGVEAQLPLQNINIYQTVLPLFIEVCVFQMRLDQDKIFASVAWHELKWT